jgi:HEAT repeat protein
VRADLDSNNFFTRKAAVERLVTLKPNNQRAEVARKLVEMTEDPSPFIRRPAVAALGVWGSNDELPALHKALEHEDPFTRHEALKYVGRFRDPRSLAPLMRWFRDGLARGEAGQALRQMGSMAERDVLAILQEPDVFLKKAAIEVLEDIGTQASVPALQEAAAHGGIHLAGPAQKALAAIARRRQP